MAHEPLVFPVQIPRGFAPTDYDGDGVDRNWRGRHCPGFRESDGYRPRWGGGFDAPRGPGGRSRHRAIDIMAAEGAEVRAVRDGTVQVIWRYKRKDRPGAGTSPKGGNYCRIIYDDGYTGYYAHMRDPALVGPGDQVHAGQLIGFVGRTGNAVRTHPRTGKKTGCPHLHYSLTSPSGRMVDPVPKLRVLYDAGGWQRGAPAEDPVARRCECCGQPRL